MSYIGKKNQNKHYNYVISELRDSRFVNKNSYVGVIDGHQVAVNTEQTQTLNPLSPNQDGSYDFFDDRIYVIQVDNESYKFAHPGSDFNGKSQWDATANIIS